MEALEEAMSILEELREDTTLPKSIRVQIEEIIANLKDESAELAIRRDRALATIEELSMESTLEAYTRTQLFYIVSLLESLGE